MFSCPSLSIATNGCQDILHRVGTSTTNADKYTVNEVSKKITLKYPKNRLRYC